MSARQNLGPVSPIVAGPSAVHTGSTATSLLPVTVPAYMITPGARIEIVADGITLADNSSNTLTLLLRIKSGALAVQTLVTTGAVDAVANAPCKLQGVLSVASSTVLYGSGEAYLTATTAGAPLVGTKVLDATTFSSDNDLVVDVYATWSDANAGNQVVISSIKVQVIPGQVRS